MHPRRRWLGGTAALVGYTAASGLGAQTQPFPGEPHQHPMADPDYRMHFPRDFGAHAGFRTEWWYVTGWLDGDRGFQVTFFRARTAHPSTNPSRFAPTQLLFAQAALMLPAKREALHAQRAARLGSPGISFSETDTNLVMGNWALSRGIDDRYRAVIRDAAFTLDLMLAPPGEPGQEINRPWLQGELGFSRKGPQPAQASHYYSRPQLRVGGRVDDKPVKGIAWFDHEWSTTVLDPSAAGWDWTGINLDDGSALVAFRIRRRPMDASVSRADGAGTVEEGPLWDYCAWRHPDGRTEQVGHIGFDVLRRWRSPRTSAVYPISMRLALPRSSLRLEPLFEDQEIDGRQSTGTIYWEGAVRVLNDAGVKVGLGYLELTGYHTALRL